MLRPERRRDVVGRVAAGGVAAGDRAVLLRVPPVLQPHRTVRSGKARAVAGREDRGIGGAAMVVDHDAVLHVEPGGLRERVVRHRAGADHDQVGRRWSRRPWSSTAKPSVRQRAAAPAIAVPMRMSTPCARWRSWMKAEVSSSQTRARMRGAISITVILRPSLGGRGGDLQPDHAAADHEQRLAAMRDAPSAPSPRLRCADSRCPLPGGNIGSMRLIEPVASTSAS